MTLHVTLLTSLISRNAGGLFNSVRRLGQSLDSEFGIQTSVLGVEDEFSGSDVSAWKPLVPQIYPRFGPRAFQFAPKMFGGLLATNSDLVHVHGLWTYPSVACSRWHQKTGKPYLISPRGMLDPWALRNSSWKKKIASFLFESRHLRRAKCLHALCRSEALSMRRYGLTNPICIVANGVDLPPEVEPSPEIKNPSTLPKTDRKNLLFLGRIHPKKGLETALKAWNTVRTSQEARSWRFLIAGWDQEGHVDHLKRLCTELGIKHCNMTVTELINGPETGRTQETERCALDYQDGFGASVVFLGPAFGSEKDQLLRASDAFILPSFSEGLPMAVLEAWAYQLPVLMTPECNLPDGYVNEAALRITHSTSDGSSPPLPSIASGLQTLFEMSGQERLEMGRRARRLVQDCYTWTHVSGQIRDVYTWVAGGGSPPATIEC